VTEAPPAFGEARRAAHDAMAQADRRGDASAWSAPRWQRRSGASITWRSSRRIVELHAEGVAWSVAGDIARGDETVAAARYERDVAEAVSQAQEQAGFRLNADRRVL
jgi:hypothetical protein